MIDNEKDEQLWAEVQKMINGDFSGYENMYQLSIQTIYRIINDVVNDSNESVNLVPEVYNHIYKNIHKLGNPKSFYQWADIITRDYVVRHLSMKNSAIPATAAPSNQAVIGNGVVSNQAPIGNGVVSNQAPIGNGVVSNQAPIGSGAISNQAPIGNGAISAQTVIGSGGIGTGTAGTVTGGMATLKAAKGISLGAKIAIWMGGVATAAAIGVGSILLVQHNKKEKATTTEITTEIASAEETTEEITTVEETTEETVDVDEIFRSYMRDVLIPEQGMCTSGRQTQTVYSGMQRMEACEIGGVAASYIADWDKDGVDEMMVLTQTSIHDNSDGEDRLLLVHDVSIYEWDGEQVIMQSVIRLADYFPGAMLDPDFFGQDNRWENYYVDFGFTTLDVSMAESETGCYLLVEYLKFSSNAGVHNTMIYGYSGSDIQEQLEVGYLDSAYGNS